MASLHDQSASTGLCMTVDRLAQLLRLLQHVAVAKWDRQDHLGDGSSCDAELRLDLGYLLRQG